MISGHFQGKPFYIMVIQVYVPTTNTKEAEVDQFYEDLQHFLELTPKQTNKQINKQISFQQRVLECKNRKTSITQNN